MPAKRSKPRASRTRGRSSKRAKETTSQKKEEAAFVRSLVAHGQAVAVPRGGKLPPGATHELVKDDDGELRVIRKRFSAL